MKDKSMSDNDVNDFVFKKLMGDMDGIEASNIFAENDEPAADPHQDGTKIETAGMSIHIKPMAGQQTKDMPKIEEDDDEEDMKLGM